MRILLPDKNLYPDCLSVKLLYFLVFLKLGGLVPRLNCLKKSLYAKLCDTQRTQQRYMLLFT